MKKNFNIIIFWGAVWGLEEATIGHLLHITLLNIGSFIWFPLAYLFMAVVYKKTGKIAAVLMTSSVAASIKLVNLFMTSNLVIVVCPMLSIVLEGITFYAVIRLIHYKQNTVHPFLKISAISLLWRTLYAAGVLALPVWIMPSYPYGTVTKLFKLIPLEGIVNSATIYITIILCNIIASRDKEKHIAYIKLKAKMKTLPDLCYKPAASISVLTAAFIVQWMW